MIISRKIVVFILWIGFRQCFSDEETAEKPSCPKDDTFDFIVVGSGSAGSVVAARLSEASSVRVLLLETGKIPTRESFIPYRLGGFGAIPKHLKYTYSTVPQKNCCKRQKERKVTIYQGMVLGGTSNINGQIFTRGSRKDYETWEKMGNKGWGYKDNFKYFLKIEDYKIPFTEDEAPYHSTGGPITVSRPSYKTVYSQIFLDAAQEIGHYLTDVNAKTMKGFSFNPFLLKNDLRFSNYRAYLLPAMNRTNFKILMGAMATKILFNSSKTATGVEFDYDGQKCTVKATKEIIISAGALNSPKILMLSGVGAKEKLEKFQIPVVLNLPGVGENLADHVYVTGTTYFGNITDIPSESSYDTFENTEKLLLPMTSENIGFITTSRTSEDWPDVEMMHVTAQNLPFTIRYYQALYPDDPNAEERAKADYMKNYNFSVMISPPMDIEKFLASEESKIINYHDKHVGRIQTALMHPKSRGSVSLASADPADPPVIDPNYLDHPDDVQALIEGLNETYRLMDSEAFRRMGIYLFDVGKFHDCGEMDRMSAKNLECIVRTFSGTGLHFVSSNRMGPKNDPMAVVDNKLRVYGIKGLRIADASVIPLPITGHTHLPTVMVGERAADLIKATWKLDLRKFTKS